MVKVVAYSPTSWTKAVKETIGAMPSDGLFLPTDVVQELAATSIPKVLTKTWVNGLTVTQLVSVLKQARDAYYNTGKPLMTDLQFDTLEDILRAKSPDNAYWSKVGSEVTKVEPGRPKKVKLAAPMGSLGKVRTTEQIVAWAGEATSFNVSDKEDGISMQVTGGKKMRAFTRGDGSVGQDITHLLPHIKGVGTLPNEKAIIRGELGTDRATFAKYLSKDFENPRNFTSGIANSKGVSPNAKHMTLIIHTVMKPATSIAKAVTGLKSRGWKVVPFTTFKGDGEALAEWLPGYLEKRKAASLFDIDGLVITKPDGSAIAFKGKDEEATAVIDRVEWQTSRYGKLTPVLHLKDGVRLAGVTVKKASAYNARYVADNYIGKGARVTLVRSGEVIPKVQAVLKKGIVAFPPVHTFKWDENRVDIYLSDTEHKGSADVKVRQLTHFLSTIGVEGAKHGQMAYLVEAGIDTVSKLLKVTEKKLIDAGFGKVQATNLLKQLPEKVKAASVPMLMDASGIFPRGWGLSRSTSLLDGAGGYDKVLQAAKSGDMTVAVLFAGIHGFGASLADGFAKNLLAFDKWMTANGLTPTYKKPKAVKGPLSGTVWVFSKVRDKVMETRIVAKGGSIGNSISSSTSYLVVPSTSDVSTKISAARAKGVKIVTLTQADKIVGK